ncbi:hypothetical protein [Mesorhizobium sp.]|uniref:hypothetical protein n=1 Tax=Mesorhizobium sp. TaxID=1871066 RepID=UPI00122BB0E0|nr:hypothetical protein [Mesorhizobium sp.]TIN80745.1 MAG: hypothetical protein E5Y09_02675 [Mesorhizobium sp.]
MGKHESPPLKMTIEGGKLVPATAYDAERLDSYRRGTKVNVVMVRDGGRVMERKWFAVLGLVVKQCNVPWQNKEQASEAVKLALGIVNLTKTVGGDFMAYPKSLTELTDPELDEAVRDMMDLIHRMTGIDPATLKKEIADVGEDEHEPSEVVAPSSDAGSEEAPSPGQFAADPIDAPSGEKIRATKDATMDAAPMTGQSTVGAASPDQSEPVGGPVEEDAPEVSEPDKPVHGEQAASSSEPSAEADRDWLKLVAKMLWAATGVGEQDVLKNQLAAVRTAYTPATISDQARAKANSINAKCKLVCFGEASAADTLPLIAGIAGCEVKDITT